MMTIRKATDRGHANHGWLDTWHTFSFAGYYDAEHMGYRSLRVINDDTIAAGTGFDTHPHRDMEIITYVLSGALEHKDSMGHGGIIRPGQVQYMAAGTGVLHSEFNPDAQKPGHFLQIWILPDRKGVKPRYEQKSLEKLASGQLHLVASGDGRNESIRLHQDADLYLARLKAGEKVTQPLRPDRHAWVHLAEGKARLNGQELAAGDGVALSGENSLELAADSDAQILLFDLN
jgi:quercetin 2,3-dioxygenase